MYRHESLKPLSRDHHLTLRYAKRLVEMADCDAAGLQRHWADIRLRFARYWSEALAPHFRAEEEALPWPYVDNDWREQLIDDHFRIGVLFRHLMSHPEADIQVLRELGERLATHTRWEEHVLFAAFQQRAPAEALAQVAKHLMHADNLLVDLGWLPPRLTAGSFKAVERAKGKE